ncbi:MAG: preprotein translocase subunit YajC [Bacteroidetes bacterium]|nr:preprotein translocase subunit YajC [Bacteroidota bacterium]MBS1685540.1 preprotein translocase subunit YajC [Bacteroidota bacterium]
MDPKIMILIYAAMFAVIYFFFIRPQSQKVKKERAFVDGLQKGDKVVTTNGIHGRIDKVDDTTFLVEIASNVKIRIEKSGISTDLTQAVAGKAEEKKA